MNAKWFLPIGLLAAISAIASFAVQARDKPAAAGKAVRAYITNFGGDGISVVDPVKGVVVTNIATGVKPHGVASRPMARPPLWPTPEAGT